MWLTIGIGLPIVWFVTIALCDTFRDHLNPWMDWWLLMFTYTMPWIAIFAGVMHILST